MPQLKFINLCERGPEDAKASQVNNSVFDVSIPAVECSCSWCTSSGTFRGARGHASRLPHRRERRRSYVRLHRTAPRRGERSLGGVRLAPHQGGRSASAIEGATHEMWTYALTCRGVSGSTNTADAGCCERPTKSGVPWLPWTYRMTAASPSPCVCCLPAEVPSGTQGQHR